jgi:hypothetical protein
MDKFEKEIQEEMKDLLKKIWTQNHSSNIKRGLEFKKQLLIKQNDKRNTNNTNKTK